MGHMKWWLTYELKCRSLRSSWNIYTTWVCKNSIQTITSCPHDKLTHDFLESQWLAYSLLMVTNISTFLCTFCPRNHTLSHLQKLAIRVRHCPLNFLTWMVGHLCSPFVFILLMRSGPNQPKRKNSILACFVEFLAFLRTV